MNFKVAPTMKGKFVVNALGRSYRAGEEFSLTEEQCVDGGIQFAVTNKMIEAIGDFKSINLIAYKNISRTKVSIGSIVCAPQQLFYVSAKDAMSVEVQTAIKCNLIALDTPEATIEAAPPAAEVKASKESKKIRKAGEKTIMATVKKSEVEPLPQKKDREDMSLNERFNNPPEGVHIARPDIKNTKPRDLLAEYEAEKNQGIAFADHEQAKERIIKFQKAVQDRANNK